MITLKLFRVSCIWRNVSCRLVCTEPPDSGSKDENIIESNETKISKQAECKEENIIKENENKINKQAALKKKMASLLSSLGQPAPVPEKEFVAKTVNPKILSEITKKYLREDICIKVKEAVNNVALHYGGDRDKTMDELHKRLKSHTATPQSNMKNLLSNMDVDHEKQKEVELMDDSLNVDIFRDSAMSDHSQGRSGQYDDGPGRDFPSRRRMGPQNGQEGARGGFPRRERPQFGHERPREGFPPMETPQFGHELPRPGMPFKGRPRYGHGLEIDYENLTSLQIFPEISESDATASKSQLTTWDKCESWEMLSVSIKAPKNAFEEMIRWTDSGRMRKFPIDNEESMDVEKQYTFADHIFLERHLDPWLPKKGPIRHFMILVCHGLSKNPYLTVNRKLAHIQWYQQYFMKKENSDMLKNAGIPSDALISSDAKKLRFVRMKDYVNKQWKKAPDPIKKKKRGSGISLVTDIPGLLGGIFNSTLNFNFTNFAFFLNDTNTALGASIAVTTFFAIYLLLGIFFLVSAFHEEPTYENIAQAYRRGVEVSKLDKIVVPIVRALESGINTIIEKVSGNRYYDY